MDLRARLKKDFYIDLPIAGGDGCTREEPIVIHCEQGDDYRAIEYKVLLCLGIEGRADWKLKQQTVIETDDCVLDEVTIEVSNNGSGAAGTRQKKYYFDISRCASVNERESPSLLDNVRSRNSVKVDPEAGTYRVLDRLTLQVGGNWWWFVEDISEAHVKGAVLKTWGISEPDGPEAACITVMDATRDPTEPVLVEIDDDALGEIDVSLRQRVELALHERGDELVQWVRSEFSEINNRTCLVTAYVAAEHGTLREYITLRLTGGDTKFIVQACYDSGSSEQFAEPVFNALQSVAIIGD